MSDFNVPDAALSGLRMIGRKPKVLAWWIAFSLVAVGAYLGLVFLLFGDVFRQFVEMIVKAAGGAESEQLRDSALQLLFQTIPRLGLATLVLLPLGLLYSAMRKNAAARAMLAPDDDRFGYLRIGADEFRSAVVILALGIIRFVVQIIFYAGIGMVAAIFVGASNSVGNRVGAQFLQQALELPMYAVLVFLFLKFAFAIPHTLATRRISIFESWSQTNGHVVRMLLTYVIVFAIMIAVSIAAGIVGFGLAAVTGGAQLVQIIPLFQTDVPGALNQLFALLPGLMVAISVVAAIFTPFATALYYCPAAYIYDRVRGGAEDVFE